MEKKIIIAASPLVLLLCLLIIIDEGLVAGTIHIAFFAVFVALIIGWLHFVENHFNED